MIFTKELKEFNTINCLLDRYKLVKFTREDAPLRVQILIRLRCDSDLIKTNNTLFTY